MRQAPFTIVTPILAGELEALSALLAGMGDDIAQDAHLALSAQEALHYASFSVFEIGGRDCLLFEGNVDGTPRDFLRELLARSGPGVDEVYAHCDGYPPVSAGDPEHTVDFLLHNDIGTNTFYVAWPGRTARSIGFEALLRKRILGFLDGEDRALLEQCGAAEVRQRVVDHVRGDPELAPALSPEPVTYAAANPRAVLAAVAAPPVAALLGLAATAVGHGRLRGPARALVLTAGAAAATVAVRLRRSEAADDAREQARTVPWDVTYAEWSELPAVQRREDVQNQNHLASIVDLKPGAFRRWLLTTVLAVVQAAAALNPEKGSLGGIGSIHFARWTLTPDRKRLVFLSNFDGSWESYLGDFIDLAARGLTAVWTNTDNAVGFPRTRWLVDQGARDEARFKAFARFGMVQTLLWYSAYPDLSVSNIADNHAVREGLAGELDDEQAERWVARL